MDAGRTKCDTIELILLVLLSGMREAVPQVYYVIF